MYRASYTDPHNITNKILTGVYTCAIENCDRLILISSSNSVLMWNRLFSC
jgi:hypothetical protein